MKKITTLFVLFLLSAGLLFAQPVEKTTLQKFEPLDVFQPEHVSDPQISPDGNQVIYARNFRGTMTARTLSNPWLIRFVGMDNHPLDQERSIRVAVRFGARTASRSFSLPTGRQTMSSALRIQRCTGCRSQMEASGN